MMNNANMNLNVLFKDLFKQNHAEMNKRRGSSPDKMA